MSDVVEGAVKALNAKLGGAAPDGSVKFVILEEGAVRIDQNGASADDSEADCVITANDETFRALLGGELNPATAFMSGKLRIEGDMGLAMRLGALLA
ncbi:SCP2 sterol-binding domain-containing protein [Amaricoccus solimangrovi]|uniref:SCP2 sterol-binding domain-containing protein n=1 Tax=Amaricoccus solimangrovi TaxID=2589815 RepID=A0A501WER3_9RHOB|nr:SCP2 sterol-binding domain-containing protein [Amaricoccus solimangrovi]TPE48323.1 SCP2 sterol-binding domain-containing protein [Amaricoccus solimangrovi]